MLYFLLIINYISQYYIQNYIQNKYNPPKNDQEYIKNIIYKKTINSIKIKKYLHASDIFFTYYNKYNKDPRSENALFKSCVLLYSTLNKIDNSYNKLEILNRIKIYINRYNNNYEKCIILKKIKNIVINKLLYRKIIIAYNYFLMGYYESSILLFNNILQNYNVPKYKKIINFYIILSFYKLTIQNHYLNNKNTLLSYCKMLIKKI
jgi:hypothetical protein